MGLGFRIFWGSFPTVGTARIGFRAWGFGFKPEPLNLLDLLVLEREWQCGALQYSIVVLVGIKGSLNPEPP